MPGEAKAHNSIFEVAFKSVPALMIVLLVLTVLALIVFFTAQPAQGQTFRVIYNFTGGHDGVWPLAGVSMDQVGNLYGTADEGGDGEWFGYGIPGFGTVFKLSKHGDRSSSNRLYSFHGGRDGAYPMARVVIGPDGALYGTTSGGGDGYGTVFKLTPPTGCSRTLCPWTETVLYRFQTVVTALTQE